MAQRTGTHDINTLLANRFQSAESFGMDTIERVLQAELDAHNRVMEEALAEIAAPTTDAQSIYGSAVGGSMTEVDEYGAAPSQKATPGSTVGFPLRKKQFNIGWTRDFARLMTPRDFAIATQNAQIAHRREVILDLRRAIYGSANYTFQDRYGRVNIALTVRRFLNADGEPIPAGPYGEYYDGATETHYTAESSLTSAGLVASIRNVAEKGHGAQLQTAIALSDESTVRGLSGFVPFIDDRLLLSPEGNNPRTQVNRANIDNRRIGILDAADVWVKPWAVPSYAFTYEAGGIEKPLAYRQSESEALRGLRIAAEIDLYPLVARFMEAYYGFGVWSRTAGAVHYFGGASYTDPTI